MTTELVLKQAYRVKEINPVYDNFFGKGKGWIFRTNFLTYSQACVTRSQLLLTSIYDFEIFDCI